MDSLLLKKRYRPDLWAVFSWAVLGLVLGVLVYTLATLVVQSLPAWREMGAGLLLKNDWFFRHGRFGAAGMVYGTVVVGLLALILALPLALGAAIWMAEYLAPRSRWVVKVLIESLAAVPSVVYGLLGVLILRRWMGEWLAPLGAWSGDTLLTGGVLLAIMILPTLTTLTEDALQNVSQRQRAAARGLGLNRGEVVWAVTLRQAMPGVLAAGLLGLGRALGETIAVYLVIGRMDNQFPEKLFSGAALVQPGQTLTSKLGGSETHIALGDPVHWGAMMALCLLLLGITGLCAGTSLFLNRLWKANS